MSSFILRTRISIASRMFLCMSGMSSALSTSLNPWPWIICKHLNWYFKRCFNLTLIFRIQRSWFCRAWHLLYNIWMFDEHDDDEDCYVEYRAIKQYLHLPYKSRFTRSISPYKNFLVKIQLVGNSFTGWINLIRSLSS